MTTTVNTIATIVLAGAALSLAATANSADLEVSIEGLRSAEGQARVALHQRVPSTSFPDEDGAVAKISRSADPNGVRVVFTGLSPGDYAVAAFHDADGDGELGAEHPAHSHRRLRFLQRCPRLHGDRRHSMTPL